MCLSGCRGRRLRLLRSLPLLPVGLRARAEGGTPRREDDTVGEAGSVGWSRSGKNSRRVKATRRRRLKATRRRPKRGETRRRQGKARRGTARRMDSCGCTYRAGPGQATGSTPGRPGKCRQMQMHERNWFRHQARPTTPAIAPRRTPEWMPRTSVPSSSRRRPSHLAPCRTVPYHTICNCQHKIQVITDPPRKHIIHAIHAARLDCHRIRTRTHTHTRTPHRHNTLPHRPLFLHPSLSSITLIYVPHHPHSACDTATPPPWH